MIHLKDDEIYRLAVIANELGIYSDQELKMMEHLEECEECYDTFNNLLVLMEIMDDGIIANMDSQENSKIYSMADGLEHCRVAEGSELELEPATAATGEKILALIKVGLQKVQDSVSVWMKQLDQDVAFFIFEPQIKFAARGGGDSQNTVFKMEEIEDEKSFIIYDPEKRELMLQLHGEVAKLEKLAVRLIFEHHQERELLMEQDGKLYKGILTDLPEENFQIQIVADEK